MSLEQDRALAMIFKLAEAACQRGRKPESA
jgi:hypothetical protein